MGIIALIIAIGKGRTGWAWFFGLWILFAIVMALTGNSKLAFGPGPVCFVIALTMQNYRKNPPDQSKEERKEFEENDK